jgi:hypothetical protein
MPDFTAETRPSTLVWRSDILASGATSASHFAARCWLNVSSNPTNVVIFYVSTPDTPFLDSLHH